MKQLKLGIIGLSEGNGHPYSWAAIFNGYNPEFMKDCPFPVIPQYLAQQNFPQDSIAGAKVTHIWTQDKKLSEHVAKATNIEYVENNYENMIGKIDAVLLARDDYENHYEMSKPFIKAGLPIYIDKPLTTKTNIAKHIFDLEKYDNQIFTCSAIAYAKEFCLPQETIDNLGKLQYIDACIMKDWKKYGIHIIEPVLKIIGNQGKIQKTDIIQNNTIKKISLAWKSGLITSFTTLGQIPSPIVIRLFGTNGYKNLILEDTFFAFKKALQTFVNIILKKENPPSKDFTMQVVEIIEKGLK